MRRLLTLLLLLVVLPASAGLFDSKPSPTLGAPLGAPLNNSADFLPVREAFRLSLVESSPTQVKLRFVAAEGYYLYRHRFAFKTQEPGVTIGEAQLPAGEQKTDDYFGEVEVYYGVLDIEVPVDNPEQRPFTLQVSYQGCADKGLCYPPETENLTIGGIGAASTAAPNAPEAKGELSWRAIGLFFLAGLGLTFTPCVLPMLPILSGVVLRGQTGGMRSFLLSLAYVLPMAGGFALLGALMGVFGAELNLQARLQSPWILVPFALFFVAFALAMFGLFELRLPQALSARLDRVAGNARGGSFTGAALLGAISSLLVSPCVSAPLAGALLYISASGDALGGGLKLFALGLGMGAPLVLFATGGGALLPRSGPWMVSVRNTFGVLLLAVAVWMLERVLPGPLALALWGLLAAGSALFLGTLEFTQKTARQKLAQLLGLVLLVYALAAWVGALQGNSDPLRPLPQSSAVRADSATGDGWLTLATTAELDAQLAAARAAGQPLMLDWYADWCVSCKVFEREVFAHPQVAPRLAGYRLIRFDITDSNAEQRALLDRYQLFGPPAILFFDRAGNELKDVRVVGELDAREFGERLDRAERSL
ncbi:protein-disulfide reductase DsbD [Stutzerimonas degradans]|uniref:Thiol:disulfide interchange protein DsbD n=1 Tax=Stutzerimonas degradans TaxID=2968968 RepID=A0A8E2QB15_9GAMM|nr:protein-disulfide reductase DsbD [Stutzerimonas degradans]MCQ4276980.1 protein-disulfide reductase DsbD [Stutzerimonas degradans]PNF75157.1 protein-disulfide reductase DsbD [Stutzerimonas degradans]QPT21636.1 protein-disulfide reductase DsbD [Stutzerimonas degradans]